MDGLSEIENTVKYKMLCSVLQLMFAVEEERVGTGASSCEEEKINLKAVAYFEILGQRDSSSPPALLLVFSETVIMLNQMICLRLLQTLICHRDHLGLALSLSLCRCTECVCVCVRE